jgi:hypothetical protein
MVEMRSSSITIKRLTAVYNGSDGEATKALYEELGRLGPAGLIAVNLFRAHKTSGRAKVYRGGNARGRYRNQAYERKSWSLGNLCTVLAQHAEKLGIQWGWGLDPKGGPHKDVLYIDLPGAGQVSFHSPGRLAGPGYPGQWDGVLGVGEMRIIHWIVLQLGTDPTARPLRTGFVAQQPEQPGLL